MRYAPPPNGLKPNKEIVTLDDYRERFKTYHQDPGLQALRAHAALLSIW